MSTYFEFIPIELLEIITYHIVPSDVNSFLTIFDSKIKDLLLQVKENWYQSLFRQEFPKFYNSFLGLLKHNHIHRWEDMYNEMNKAIPVSKRSAVGKDNMLNIIPAIFYPSILYQVLFYEDYKDMYMRLSDYLEILSNNKAWYYLYAMFNDAYNVGRWNDLTNDDFYMPLLEEFGKISSSDKIFKILSSDHLIFDLLSLEYNSDVISVLILSVNDKNYNISTKLFKWFIKKLYFEQSAYLDQYIFDYIENDNEEMVRWLLALYVNMDDRELDKDILEHIMNIPKKYKKLIKSYLTEEKSIKLI